MEIRKQFKSVSLLLTALGHPARQQIIIALAESKRANVAKLTDVARLSYPATSHHLRILKNAGLVGVAVHGSERLYYLTLKDGVHAMAGLIRMLEECLANKEKLQEENV